MKTKRDTGPPERFDGRKTPDSPRRVRPKGRITKRQLQPPFRETDLLLVNDFIKYCKGLGVVTDERELEYFEKENLLLPAVRVRHGVVDMTESGGRRYFSYGTLSHGREGWLKRYRESGLVDYPSQKRFRPWKQYGFPRVQRSVSPSVLKDYAETFYAAFQVYPVDHIQTRRRLVVMSDAWTQSSDAWVKLGEDLSRTIKTGRSSAHIRHAVLHYYRLYRLLMDTEDLWAIRRGDISQRLSELIEEHGGSRKEAEADFRDEKLSFDSEYLPRAKKLLKKHGFTVSELDHWRFVLLHFGIFGRGANPRNEYLKCIDEQMLIETEDPYWYVSQLNWLIGLCGGKPQTVKDAILGQSEYSNCPYCGRYFLPRRVDQKTCGSNECKRAGSRDWKRAKRESGQYHY